MIKDKAHRILALAPGATHLGCAVLDGEELLYHRVRAYGEKQSPRQSVHEVCAAAEEVIGHLRPTVLVIVSHRRSGGTRHTLLSAVIQELGDVALAHRLPVLTLAPATIRKFVCGTGRADKQVLCRKIAQRFSALRIDYFRWRWWKEDFQGHLFDAVGAGLVVREQLFGVEDCG